MNIKIKIKVTMQNSTEKPDHFDGVITFHVENKKICIEYSTGPEELPPSSVEIPKTVFKINDEQFYIRSGDVSEMVSSLSEKMARVVELARCLMAHNMELFAFGEADSHFSNISVCLQEMECEVSQETIDLLFSPKVSPSDSAK